MPSRTGSSSESGTAHRASMAQCGTAVTSVASMTRAPHHLWLMSSMNWVADRVYRCSSRPLASLAEQSVIPQRLPSTAPTLAHCPTASVHCGEAFASPERRHRHHFDIYTRDCSSSTSASPTYLHPGYTSHSTHKTLDRLVQDTPHSHSSLHPTRHTLPHRNNEAASSDLLPDHAFHTWPCADATRLSRGIHRSVHTTVQEKGRRWWRRSGRLNVLGQ